MNSVPSRGPWTWRQNDGRACERGSRAQKWPEAPGHVPPPPSRLRGLEGGRSLQEPLPATPPTPAPNSAPGGRAQAGPGQSLLHKQPCGGQACSWAPGSVLPQHHEPAVGCPWALGGGQARPINRGLSSGLCSSCRLPHSTRTAGTTGPGGYSAPGQWPLCTRCGWGWSCWESWESCRRGPRPRSPCSPTSNRTSSWGAGSPRASPPTRAGSGRRRTRCPCAYQWWPPARKEASTSPPPSSGKTSVRPGPCCCGRRKPQAATATRVPTGAAPTTCGWWRQTMRSTRFCTRRAQKARARTSTWPLSTAAPRPQGLR